MNIPILNVYYLLCYAWDQLEEAEQIDARVGTYEHIPDLFARVLASGMEQILKRGLDRNYTSSREEVSGVRGRIDFAASLRRNLFSTGRSVCSVYRLSHDTLHNRIIAQTIRILSRDPALDSGLAQELFDLRRRLSGLSPIALTPAVFARVQLHSNIRVYGFLLHLCRLIHELAVVDEQGGTVRFRDFMRDDRQMAALFERFILNFMRRHTTYLARSEQIRWQQVDAAEADLSFLPTMRTDISLERPGYKIVIDAKYYREAITARFGKDSVRSAHLYQLFAYLRNLSASPTPPKKLEGILLYPLVDKVLDLRWVIQGSAIRVRTLDLSQAWEGIHGDLLALVGERRGDRRAHDAAH